MFITLHQSICKDSGFSYEIHACTRITDDGSLPPSTTGFVCGSFYLVFCCIPLRPHFAHPYATSAIVFLYPYAHYTHVFFSVAGSSGVT